jgi:hypothetical protein
VEQADDDARAPAAVGVTTPIELILLHPFSGPSALYLRPPHMLPLTVPYARAARGLAVLAAGAVRLLTTHKYERAASHV